MPLETALPGRVAIRPRSMAAHRLFPYVCLVRHCLQPPLADRIGPPAHDLPFWQARHLLMRPKRNYDGHRWLRWDGVDKGWHRTATVSRVVPTGCPGL